MTPYPEDIRFGRWLRDPAGVWFYQSGAGFLRAGIREEFFDRSKMDPLWGISEAAMRKQQAALTKALYIPLHG
jgi:hypothetical protein